MNLDLQLHIRVDGTQIVTAYYDKRTSTWSDGPELTDDLLLRNEDFTEICDEIYGHAKGQKVNALGIVFHIADEFATAELKPEFDNPAALGELRQQAMEEPKEILEDGSINPEDNSFRILPYEAEGSTVIGTTITVTRQYDLFLDALRKKSEEVNFPIITQSVSAPLIAILGMYGLLEKQPEKPFVSILQYPWFTVLAFFNEHADLKLIRTLQHRGMRQASNFRNALFTTSASLEFMDPDLFIVPLGEMIDNELQATLKQNFPSSLVEILKLPSKEGLPAWCPEPGIITERESIGNDSFTSTTLTGLQEEEWAVQDFLPVKKTVAEVYPSRLEMSMVRITRYVQLLVVAIALAGVGYFGWQMFSISQTEEWGFNEEQAQVAKGRLTVLDEERDLIVHWGNLLDDRSKAWMVMESFARMFPQDSHMLIREFRYSAKPDSNPGQVTAGFVKVWKISGYARDPAIEYLNKLNTRNGINQHFAEINKITDSDAFRNDIGNRNISVNVRTRENGMFRDIPFEDVVMTDTSTYPFTFDLTITQRFEATDPMAVSVRSAN